MKLLSKGERVVYVGTGVDHPEGWVCWGLQGKVAAVTAWSDGWVYVHWDAGFGTPVHEDDLAPEEEVYG